MNERERIGQRIAELRKEKGISQAKLSELTGIGSGHIARIELGKYSTGIDTLAKIAEILEYKIDFVKKIESRSK
jgi:transcriptional regulator with XRE-family HTH domain